MSAKSNINSASDKLANNLPKKIEASLNEQINMELTAQYHYLAMSAWMDGQGFRGFAKWFRMQAEEEFQHAMKFFDYLLNRDGNVDLKPIPSPKNKYKSIIDVFQTSLMQEREGSVKIGEIYQLADKTEDFQTKSFVRWFIDEQIEEETTVRQMCDSLKIAGNEPAALFMLDKEAGQRQTIGNQ